MEANRRAIDDPATASRIDDKCSKGSRCGQLNPQQMFQAFHGVWSTPPQIAPLRPLLF